MDGLIRIHDEHELTWVACHITVGSNTDYIGSWHEDRYLVTWVIEVETRLAEFQYLMFLVGLSENCLHHLILRARKYI